MPPVSTAALVVAAFLAGLLAPRFLHGAAEPHEDHVRVSALQAANTMLQQKLRVAGDTLEQLQKNHGATIEELSTKMAEMEGHDGPAEKGGHGLGGGGQGGCKRCRKQLEACQRSSAAVPAADAPPAATAGGSPGSSPAPGAAGTFSGAGAFWSCALATTGARRAVRDRVRVALGRAPSAVAARSTPG